MKRLILIAIVALYLSTLHAQPNDNVINIGSIDGSAPYSYINGKGELEGYAVDVVKNVMKRLNTPYQFTIHNEPQAFIRDIKELNDRILSSSDLSIVAILAPAHRRLHYHSLPYSKIYYYIISTKTHPYSGFKDLAGKNIVAHKRSTSEQQIGNFPENYINKFISCIDIPSGIKLILSGKADYFLIDDYTLRRYRSFILDHDLEISLSNIEPLSIAMASNNGELIRRINQVIEQMDDDGTLRQLYEKWLIYDEEMYPTSYINAFSVALLLAVALAILLIIILRKKATRAKSSAHEVLIHNKELVYAINLLLKNGNTDLFMYNATTRRLYTLKNGAFVLYNTRYNTIEPNIHPDDLAQYSQAYHQIVSGQSDYIVTTLRVYEASVRDYRYFEYTIMPAGKDNDGVITSYFYSRRDISDVQKELKLKERVIGGFKLAMHSANLIRWRFNIKKHIITLHYSDDSDVKLTPEALLSNVSAHDAHKFKAYLFGESHGNEKEDIFIKIRLDHHHEYRTCKISSRIQRDNTGKPENIFGVINDMTDIIENSRKLEEFQVGMKLALDAGQMTAWRYDKESDSFSVLYGAHLVGGNMSMHQYMSMVHPDDNTIFPTALRQVLQGEVDNTSVSFRLNIQGIGYRWYSCTLMAIHEDGKIQYITGTRRDITSEMESRIELEKNFSKIPMPVYIVDPEHNQVVYCNEQARLVFGLEVGVISTDIYQSELGKECAKRNMEVYETGNDYTANETLIFLNGDIKYTLVKKTLVNYNGKGHILISRVDLTEQERMSQAKKLLSTSLPAFNAFTWSIDGRNQSVMYNDSGRTGVANVHEVSTIDKCLSILHPDDRANYKDTLLEYIAKGEGEFTIIYRSRTTQQDAYEWWETRGIAETVHTDAISYTVLYGITINITNLKKTHEDLIVARQKAEESEQLKMAFLANMSHEIRTPLNAIVGFSELLQETTDEEERDEFIGIINKNNELLLRLIGDILDLSKIESGSIDLKNENFDFVATIQELYDTWNQRNNNPDLKLIFDNPYQSCMVCLDKNRIKQVGINFITNAFKHTRSGSITIGHQYHEGGIRLYVRDTGVGIPKDKQGRIFERFAKLDNFSQGTGLGLAICKAITESYGGRIGFESHQNIGSTFWAWFPCHAAVKE